MDEQFHTSSEVSPETGSQDSSSCASIDERIRDNPTGAVFAAFGIGIAVALVVRALCREDEPRSKMRRLLEDVQDQIQDLADPTLQRLKHLASEGQAALRKESRRFDDLDLQQGIRGLGCKLKGLFR